MEHTCRGPPCPWLSTAVGESTTDTVGQHIYTQAACLVSTQTAHMLSWPGAARLALWEALPSSPPTAAPEEMSRWSLE